MHPLCLPHPVQLENGMLIGPLVLLADWSWDHILSSNGRSSWHNHPILTTVVNYAPGSLGTRWRGGSIFPWLRADNQGEVNIRLIRQWMKLTCPVEEGKLMKLISFTLNSPTNCTWVFTQKAFVGQLFCWVSSLLRDRAYNVYIYRFIDTILNDDNKSELGFAEYIQYFPHRILVLLVP